MPVLLDHEIVLERTAGGGAGVHTTR